VALNAPSSSDPSLYPARFPNGVPSGVPGCGSVQQFNGTISGISVRDSSETAGGLGNESTFPSSSRSSPSSTSYYYAPKFLPAGGQNDCTDGDIAIGIYPCPGWDQDGLPYQPIAPSDYAALDAECNCQTGDMGVMAAQVPKMVANLLVWNTGPLLSGQ
jgi:hypothetical protein